MSATQEDSTQVSQFDLQTTPGQGGVGEAAGMARDIAPGLQRPRWGFETWLGHKPGTWTTVLASARRKATQKAGVLVNVVAADPRTTDSPQIQRRPHRTRGLPVVERVVRADRPSRVLAPSADR